MNRVLFTDGWHSRGKAGYLVCDGTFKILQEGWTEKVITHNQAEYWGMMVALLIASDEAIIYTDSKLVWGQLTQEWKINARGLTKAIRACKELIEKKRCKIVWIPREQNLAGLLIERKQSIERKADVQAKKG